MIKNVGSVAPWHSRVQSINFLTAQVSLLIRFSVCVKDHRGLLMYSIWSASIGKLDSLYHRRSFVEFDVNTRFLQFILIIPEKFERTCSAMIGFAGIAGAFPLAHGSWHSPAFDLPKRTRIFRAFNLLTESRDEINPWFKKLEPVRNPGRETSDTFARGADEFFSCANGAAATRNPRLTIHWNGKLLIALSASPYNAQVPVIYLLLPTPTRLLIAAEFSPPRSNKQAWYKKNFLLDRSLRLCACACALG